MGENNDNPTKGPADGNGTRSDSQSIAAFNEREKPRIANVALQDTNIEDRSIAQGIINPPTSRGQDVPDSIGQSSSIESLPRTSLSSPRQKKLPLHKTDSAKSEESKEKETNSSSNNSKKDKKKLRKGKWTVEEEEYTSRVIHYFSTGLLTLPEGSTLRSYLADKLNCDPMRITKKFTGACCLGRRVYHLRDRPRASPAEVEMTKAELNHLEQRFRMRVEQEQSGMPLARRQELLLAQRQSGAGVILPLHSLQPGRMVSPWMHNYYGIDNHLPLSLAGGSRSMQTGIPPQYPLGPVTSTPSPWLLPNASDAAVPNTPSSSITQNEASLRILNNLVASWAWAQAQATASMTPAATMLQQQQHEEHQRQLRTGYEEQMKEAEQRQLEGQMKDDNESKQEAEGPAMNSKKLLQSDSDPKIQGHGDVSPAEQLQRSYEAHLESLKISSSSSRTGSERLAASAHIEQARMHKGPVHSMSQRKSSSCSPESADLSSSKKEAKNVRDEMRGDEKDHGNLKGEEHADDEEAGSILLGFINSLRQSYEDAIEEKTSKLTGEDNPSDDSAKDESQPANHSGNGSSSTVDSNRKPGTQKKRSLEVRASGEKTLLQYHLPVSTAPRFSTRNSSSLRPASVTDTSTLSRSETSSGASSQPTESSSSIEDSDSKSDKTEPSSSEESEKECPVNDIKKGPPRKRLKAGKKVKEFTAKNLAEHSKRMSEEFDSAKGENF